MRSNRINTSVLCIMSILILLTTLGFAIQAPSVAYAAPFESSGDGTYNVPLKLNMTMGSDRFSDVGIVEKVGDIYYLTITVVSPGEIADLEMQLGGKSGTQIVEENGVRKYIYTISGSNLVRDIPFTARVVQMNKTVSFSISLNFNKASKVSDSTSFLGDRPAEFVPVINTTAGNLEMEKGSKYVLPKATATLCGDPIEIEISAYYLNGSDREFVQVKDGKIDLKKAGEYHVLYRAQSDKYLTAYGNPAEDIVDVRILSKIGASVLAIIVNKDDVPKDSVVQANVVTEGSIFDTAKAGMKEIADNFEVFNVGLYTSLGEEVTLNKKVTMRLRVDDTYNRAKVEVYVMDANGNLTKCDTRGYGRYVEVQTDKVGIIIACIPGVAFVMPMWGYALIGVGSAIVLIIIIVVPIVVTKKKKKALKNNKK